MKEIEIKNKKGESETVFFNEKSFEEENLDTCKAKMDKGIIDSWLEQYGDPAIDRLVKKNLDIARKIQEILDRKQMKPVDLARLMSKQKSEISKWLSGQHTFSMRTIADIENVLDEDIVHIELL